MATTTMVMKTIGEYGDAADDYDAEADEDDLITCCACLNVEDSQPIQESSTQPDQPIQESSPHAKLLASQAADAARQQMEFKARVLRKKDRKLNNVWENLEYNDESDDDPLYYQKDIDSTLSQMVQCPLNTLTPENVS